MGGLSDSTGFLQPNNRQGKGMGSSATIKPSLAARDLQTAKGKGGAAGGRHASSRNGSTLAGEGPSRARSGPIGARRKGWIGVSAGQSVWWRPPGRLSARTAAEIFFENPQSRSR